MRISDKQRLNSREKRIAKAGAKYFLGILQPRREFYSKEFFDYCLRAAIRSEKQGKK